MTLWVIKSDQILVRFWPPFGWPADGGDGDSMGTRPKTILGQVQHLDLKSSETDDFDTPWGVTRDPPDLEDPLVVLGPPEDPPDLEDPG